MWSVEVGQWSGGHSDRPSLSLPVAHISPSDLWPLSGVERRSQIRQCSTSAVLDICSKENSVRADGLAGKAAITNGWRLRRYVTLPPGMSHIATSSLFGYSHFSKGGAIYRFWLFNEISFSSFLHQKIHLLNTQKVYVSLVSVQNKQPFNKGYMMKTLFGDFSKWYFLVLATQHCHNFRTSGPILKMFASFYLYEKSMLCTMLQKSHNRRKYPRDSFREVGSHMKYWSHSLKGHITPLIGWRREA